jgi:hypothetical protein
LAIAGTKSDAIGTTMIGWKDHRFKKNQYCQRRESKIATNLRSMARSYNVAMNLSQKNLWQRHDGGDSFFGVFFIHNYVRVMYRGAMSACDCAKDVFLSKILPRSALCTHESRPAKTQLGNKFIHHYLQRIRNL